jgi:hypothetical protein
MKLTENELNYILSECVQRMIVENTPAINTTIQQTRSGKLKNPPAQHNDEGIVDKVKNFGSKAKKFVNNNWGKALSFGLGGYQALFADTNTMITAGLGAMLTPLIMSVANKVQSYRNFKNKGVPNNINKAFELACKASKEYKNSASLCKIIQANWNIACNAYKKVVALKKQEGENWVPQTITWNSQEIQSKIVKDFVLTKGAISGVKGNVNANQDFTNLKVNESAQYNPNFQTKLNEAEIINYLKQFDNANAVEAMVQIAQLYSEAYKIYFEWRTYIAYIGKRFSITWEEIEKGSLNPGAHNKTDVYMGQFDQSEENETQNNIELSIVSQGQQIGTSTYVIMRDVNDSETYYGINTNMLTAHPILSALQSNSTFIASFTQDDFVNDTLVYAGETLKILNQKGLKKLKPQQQQQQQQQQTNNQGNNEQTT